VNSRKLLSEGPPGGDDGDNYAAEPKSSVSNQNFNKSSSEIASTTKGRYKNDVVSIADGGASNIYDGVLSKSSDNEDEAVYEEFKDLDESVPQIQ
jgi:hypothetical protein